MSSYEIMKTPGDHTWFTNDRFGLFIHFGLYAMPARHEWIKSTERITDEKYDLYYENFNPDMMDMRDIIHRAKLAGMKYAVLTTKHHEGFCLFDSKYTDYKITNTQYGRDLVREYVDACHEEGLKVGFYYSLIDWHHPEFPIDRIHPRRLDPDVLEKNKTRDVKKYAQYMRDQVTELMTNYGKIDVLWFDFTYPKVSKTGKHPFVPGEVAPEYMWPLGKSKDDWEAEELIKTVRKYNPDILINDRTGIEQDLNTPEQVQPLNWLRKKSGELILWEACQTFSGSWGYHRDESTWKSPEMLIEMLITTVSRGGNLIMNVGPTARGYLDDRAIDALKVYERWMKYNGRSIYGCTMAEPEFTEPYGTRMTQSVDGKRLYLHLTQYPYGSVDIKGLKGKIKYAQFLHDGSELFFKEMSDTVEAGRDFTDGRDLADGYVTISLPAVKPNQIVPVIEIFLK